MTNQAIKEGITQLCGTSKIIQDCYESTQALIDEINRAKREDIEKCWEYYKKRSGVIVDVRKELIEHIIDGDTVTVDLLDKIVEKHKDGKENQFKTYKNYYTIFYPVITFYGHGDLREFIKKFIAKIIQDLETGEFVKSISFDFQGARQLGSDRYWLAIYNKEQENQSTGLQLFIDFHHGSMTYGIYRHSDKNYIKEKMSRNAEDFDYEEMLSYFKSDINLILNDKPVRGKMNIINLKNDRLYKMSHGSFKQKNKSHIVDALVSNNWITLHEDTGKNQGHVFKENLKKDDYVYITLGSNKLIGIARIVSEDWDYVPNEIMGADGWISREVEFLHSPIIPNTKDLKDKGNIYPSGNSTLTEIKPNELEDANAKLFEPYFNTKFIMSDTVYNDLEEDTNANSFPLNQILYGPPGTGKTYHTILKAVEIIAGNSSFNYDEAVQVFNENLHDQIEFITFHQNYSYEDFIQGLRPDTENGKELSFEKKDGVFKRIADRALSNLTASKDPINQKRTFDSVFHELIEPLKSADVEEIEIKMKKTSFFITEVGEKSIVFRKNIGESDHTLSIATLKKMYEKGENDIIMGGLQPYYNPILDLLLKKGKSNLSPVKQKNYVIIIDEINRANISRVFGELITLIEEDKRSHGKIPLRATLPSGDSFVVPSNLHIIGTMNTADKSIALLDIALRRRFEFVPYYPNHLTNGVNDGLILERINKEIHNRKNHDFTIGHAYFMGEKYSLEKTINNKVIPLLFEYFMNDEREVKAILNSSGIEVEGWPLKMKTE
ncbi:McrB family protein [Elizabethkingia meningoseptica]|uniref:McrB family protein n=1 Tax=Elizabethkingia meningoseptica TaxID=238 RepID=UPI001C889556|nr:AAA family ATPase [Elizabethkingia meningoseptica]MDE5488257.1 AAA family ATPase [Elizabethkingia meningoseptica]